MRKRIWRLLALCCALGVILAAVPSALPSAQAADAGISWELDDKSNTLTVNGAVSQDRPVYAAFFDVDGRMLSFAVLTSPGETVPVVDGAEVCRLFSLRDGLVPESMPVNVEVAGETVWVKVKETRVETYHDMPGNPTYYIYTWSYDENWNNTVIHLKRWKDTNKDHPFENDYFCSYNTYGDRISFDGITWMSDGIDFQFDYLYDATGRVVSSIRYESDGAALRTDYEYNQDGNLIKKYTAYKYSDDTEFVNNSLIEYTYVKGLLKTIEEYSAIRSANADINGKYELDFRTIYSDFDGNGNAGHVCKVRIVDGLESNYDRSDIDYTYDKNGNILIEKGSYYLDYLCLTWESNFEYKPIKKESLPLHWSGAENEYVYLKYTG